MKSNLWLIIAALVRLVVGILSFKFIASLLGPSNFYFISQFQTLIQIFSSLTSSMGSARFSSIVASAENKSQVISIAYTSVFFIFFMGFLVFIFFHELIIRIANLTFISWTVYLVPVVGLFAGLHAIHQAVSLGLSNRINYAVSNISVSLINGMLLAFSTYFFGLSGAFSSMLFSLPFTYFLLIYIKEYKIIKIVRLKASDFLNAGGGFAVFSLITGMTSYLTHFLVRADYLSRTSVDEAGLYSAASRISEIYMGIAAVLFSIHLIPAYSSVGKSMAVLQVRKFLIKYVPLLLVIFLIIYFSSDFVVNVLIGPNYRGAIGHLTALCLPDFIKCVYWIFAYYIIRCGKNKTFFVVEMVSILIFYFISTLNFFNVSKYVPQSGILAQNIFLIIVAMIIYISGMRSHHSDSVN